MNRVSRDLGVIDDIGAAYKFHFKITILGIIDNFYNLGKQFFDVLDVLVLDIAIMITITILNAWLLIPLLLFLILVHAFRKLYLRTSRVITMLDGSLKSPVLQHLSSSVNGLQTIRLSF